MQSADFGPARISMASQSLLTTSCLHAWYEADSDVLHLEWQGRVTLSAVQTASIHLAQLALTRRYERVLICTYHVQAVGYEVAGWLAPRLLPGLRLLGVRHLAWVCSPAPGGPDLTQHVCARLPPLLTRLFADMAAAEAWLRSCPAAPAQRPYTAAEATRVRRVVRAWQWQVLAALARHPLWPLTGGEGSE